MSNETILSVRDLRVSFRLGEQLNFQAVKGVSFDVAANSTVALVGESGSGKSVTALSILGLLPKDSADILAGSEIWYQNQDLLKASPSALRDLRGAKISMIFQEPMSSLNPVFRIGEQIAEALQLHLGLSKRQARTRIIELLGEVGILDPESKIDAYPFQLSGGQQQRVMIAMAIACEPQLLIADEPTTALDVTIQKQILDLLASLQRRRRMSMLFITHDLAVVGNIADFVVVMRNGEVQEQGPAAQIFEHAQHPYTQALLQCRPRIDRRPRRLPVIEDFIGKSGPAGPKQEERKRGLTGNEPIVLDVRHLGKSFFSREGWFKQKEFKAVKNVSFKLAKGKTLGLVGESGSGKTTVGLTLVRLHDASSGEALFEGKDLLALSQRELAPYRRRIQIIFQNPYASLNPRFTVAHILTEPMVIHGIGNTAQERTHLAAEWLDKVGLPESSLYKYPHEFSGGQRQRIAIARCLTMRPEVLICDESVSALDVSVQAQVLNLLQDLQDELQLSYLFISHDLAVVQYIADQVMVMNEGEIVEIANSDDIYLRPAHPYAQKLLASIPRGWSGSRKQNDG